MASTTALPRPCHGPDMLWLCHGTAMALPWHCCASAMVAPRQDHDIAMAEPRQCHGIHGNAMAIPWSRHGNSRALQLQYHATATARPRLCHGSEMPLAWPMAVRITPVRRLLALLAKTHLFNVMHHTHTTRFGAACQTMPVQHDTSRPYPCILGPGSRPSWGRRWGQVTSPMPRLVGCRTYG